MRNNFRIQFSSRREGLLVERIALVPRKRLTRGAVWNEKKKKKRRKIRVRSKYRPTIETWKSNHLVKTNPDMVSSREGRKYTESLIFNLNSNKAEAARATIARPRFILFGSIGEITVDSVLATIRWNTRTIRMSFKSLR